ncbi:uncharacterized protein Dwil_GK11044 [Drosophila willistoni]|uniref:Protein takeout n=1 Tax=Drosophila willistoni TaxID=7260 RepID=B4N8E3_DROWI|nr:uncharacterized protein LOC6647733 [Drosophila willistoni]EDW81394.1 uncharacterized protein Dwil_GK11044 [Drosophila willistoni]
MQIKNSKSLSLLLFSIITIVGASKYLAERPSYLTPCVTGDSGFNKCLASNFQTLFHQWKDGIPGTNTVGSLDPLFIKRVKFTQDPQRSIALNADLHDVYVTGGSQSVVKEARYDADRHVAKAVVFIPFLRFAYDYKVKGHVVALNLNGHGKGFFELQNAEVIFVLSVTPDVQGDVSFAKVDSMKVSFHKIGNFHIQLDGLFEDKELERSANMLFNDNWREFYEVLRPAAEQTVEGVLLDRFRKTFNYVPANYFIKDFH